MTYETAIDCEPDAKPDGGDVHNVREELEDGVQPE